MRMNSSGNSNSKLEMTQDIIITAISILGTIGNAFVLIIVFRAKDDMKNSLSTIFLVNQSLLDGTASILLMTDHWTERLIDVKSLEPSIVQWYCKAWFGGVPVWGILAASTYNLVVLSLERYLCVRYPIAHKNFSYKKTILIAFLIWMIFIPYQFSHQTTTSKVLEDGTCGQFSNWPNDSTRRGIGIFLIFIQFILPLIIITFTYTSLAIIFSRRNSNVHPLQNNQIVNNTRIRKNSIKTFALVAFAFIFCWFWNQTYFLGFQFNLIKKLDGDYYQFTVFMVFVNCCVNPFIYTFRYDKFKKELHRYFIFKLFFNRLNLTNKIEERNYSDNTASIVQST